MAYASLEEARRELKADTTTDDGEDIKLLRMLDVASNRMNHVFGQTLEPLRQTRPFYLRPDRINSYERLFSLDKWFLALNGVTVYNTALTVGTHVESYVNGYSPYRTLRLKRSGDDWYSTWADGDYTATVYVGADWGFRPYYITEGWRHADYLGADINAVVTAVSVGEVDGADWENRKPRFSPGQLIRIDDEWMRVLETNATTDVLTVRRGENGSTAAVHTAQTCVEIFYPEDMIRHTVARHAALLYKRRGAFDTPQGDFGGAAYPRDLEVELLDTLQGYMHYVGP